MTKKRSREEILGGTEQDYLRMPYNKMLWLRLEFMVLCEDELEAFLMRIVEYEIEGERMAWLKKAIDRAQNGLPLPDEPDEWWVTLSYKQIMMRLYGVVKNEKTVIAKMTSLIKKQFLMRRINPDNVYGAPQYTIHRELVQEKLDALPALPSMREIAKRHEVKAVDPVPASGTPPFDDTPYQQMVPPVPADGTPRTTSYHSPVPADGTPPYQQMVPSYKYSNNTVNKLKETEEDGVHASASHRAHTLENDSQEEMLQDDVLLRDDSRYPDQLPFRESNGNTGVLHSPDTHEQTGDHSYSPTRQQAGREKIDATNAGLDYRDHHRVTQHAQSPGHCAHGGDTANTQSSGEPASVLHHSGPGLAPAHQRQDPATSAPAVVVASTSVRDVAQVTTPDQTGGNTKARGGKGRAQGDAAPTGVGGKAARKPTKAQIIASKQERITKVYEEFDQLAQEATGNSEYHYPKYKKTNEAIAEWLDQRPTQELLRTVYQEMANDKRDPRTGFSWADHMDIESVIKQCNKRALTIQIKQKQAQPKKPTTTVIYEEEETRPVVIMSRFMAERRAQHGAYASTKH